MADEGCPRVTTDTGSETATGPSCNCHSLWCWLDHLTECRHAWICNLHDRHIRGDDDDR